MKETKYDRLRRLEALEQLLARFARKPLGGRDIQMLRHSFRVRRIIARLFPVLWELPLDLQTGFCSALAQRMLPAFERRHPTLASMRNFLSPDWLRQAIGHSRANAKARWEQLGYELDDLHQALGEQSPVGGDESLYSSAVELWQAHEPDASPVTVTYASICCATGAIGAERQEAWEHLNPEAAEYVRAIYAKSRCEGSIVLPPEAATKFQVPEADPAAQAIWFAGWDAAVAWLRSAHLKRYDEVKDRSTLAEAVRRARTGWWRFA